MSEPIKLANVAGPVGLAGSHRVGKTTLAEAFAKQNDIPFLKTSVSEVFSIIGRDPKVDYPIEERIVIQEAILFALEKQYESALAVSPVFITDRTPIDLASYMMADVLRTSFMGSPALSVLVNDYVARCIFSVNRWFSTVVLVQPGIPIVEAVGKAPGCPAFIEHINLVQSGLLVSEKIKCRQYVIPRRILSLEQRLQSLTHATCHAINGASEALENLKKAGVLVH